MSIIDEVAAVPGSRKGWQAGLARCLSGGQGFFYFVTGVWPLAHIDSFQAVTGPKSDLWLVYTVGVLVATVGCVLLSAARSRRVTPEVRLLAGGVAGGLAGIDVVFVTRGVIAPVYLLDAAAEVCLILGWTIASVYPSTSRP
jgi:hypothetical protein